MNIIGMRTGLN